MNGVAMVWVGDGIMDTITGTWASARRAGRSVFSMLDRFALGAKSVGCVVLTETRRTRAAAFRFLDFCTAWCVTARGTDERPTMIIDSSRIQRPRWCSTSWRHRGPGVHATPHPGCRADDHRGDRRRGEAAGAAPAGDPGGRAGCADLEAVQAGQPGTVGRSDDRGQGSDDRRRPPGDDCRPVADRERAVAHGGGGAGQGGGGQHPPRRGIQTAHQPVQLPRAG